VRRSGRKPPKGASDLRLPIRGWARAVRIVVPALAGSLLGFVLFDRVLMPLVVKSGQEVEVPNVLLMEQAAADSALERLGLDLSVAASRNDPDLAPGRLMDQVPAPGMQVKRGRTVRVLLSLGPHGRRIPEIRGQPVSHARLLLSREGVRLGNLLSVASAEVPEHTVLAADPGPGAAVPEDGRVDLLVSQGPQAEIYLMPDVRGGSASQIRRMLEQAKIRVEVRPWPGQPEDADVIVEQTPPPGHRLREGGGVELLTGRRGS
jgi:serine/threonine-protein kinase